MNSRDAAFAEEQLRLAIEESKREGESVNVATDIRKGKRSRSDSEEYVHIITPNYGSYLSDWGYADALKTQKDSEQLPARHPRTLKAKIVDEIPTQKKSPKSRSD